MEWLGGLAQTFEVCEAVAPENAHLKVCASPVAAYTPIGASLLYPLLPRWPARVHHVEHLSPNAAVLERALLPGVLSPPWRLSGLNSPSC